MEWWLNHVGQMAQSVQDYSIATSKDLANLSEDSDRPALSLSSTDQTWFELSSDCSDEEKEQMIKAAAFIKSCLRHSDK